MNFYDEWYVLVCVFELKEVNGGSVIFINVGLVVNDMVICKGFVIGVDEVVWVDVELFSVFFVVKQIVVYVRKEVFDVVFLGKEIIDYNGFEVGVMVVELFDVFFIFYVFYMEMDGDMVMVMCDIEGGNEVVEVKVLFVVFVVKGLVEQCIFNMWGIMMVKCKFLKVELVVEVEDFFVVVYYELLLEKGDVKLVDLENMDELVCFLYEEVKVI